MCGIVCALHFGEKTKEPVGPQIVNQYEEQFGRGTEGFGLIKIESTKKPITILRATEPIKALIDIYMNPVMGAVFHHRSPTATKNSLGQTHPIVVKDDKLTYNYAVVHNGCIQNADEMYKKHKELNFLYTTYYLTHYPHKGGYVRSEQPVGKFNDSESIAIELARFLENKIDKIEAHGSAAFIVLQCTKDWKPLALHFGRNDKNPLKMEKSADSLYLSSEGVGELLAPGIIYTSLIENPSLALTERPFTMAEPTIPTYTNWGGRSSIPTYRGMCIEKNCNQEKIKGTHKCAEHCEIKFLTGAYGTEGDSRKTCVFTNCKKKRREGMEYCKKHKVWATPDKTPTCIVEYPLIDKTCSGCEHDPTTTKYPAGFKSNAEKEALDAKNTEIKEKDGIDEDENENYQFDDEYCMLDDILREYFDILEKDELPDTEDYLMVMRGLMDRAQQKVLNKLTESNINPQEHIASMGQEAIKAENFLMADEEYDLEQEEKAQVAQEDNAQMHLEAMNDHHPRGHQGIAF